MLKLHVPWEDAGLELLRASAWLEDLQRPPRRPLGRRWRAARRAEIVSSAAPSWASTPGQARAEAAHRHRLLDGHLGLRRLRRRRHPLGRGLQRRRASDRPTGMRLVPATGTPVTDRRRLVARTRVKPLRASRPRRWAGSTGRASTTTTTSRPSAPSTSTTSPATPTPRSIPGLLLQQPRPPQLNFFYTGRHYAALFLSLPAPYSWNYTTFTLSTLGNLSDQSFITRLDYSLHAAHPPLVEAFAASTTAAAAGEFRLGFDNPPRRPSLNRTRTSPDRLRLSTSRCRL